MTPERPADKGEFYKVTEEDLWRYAQKYALPCEAAQSLRRKQKGNASWCCGTMERVREMWVQILTLPFPS